MTRPVSPLEPKVAAEATRIASNELLGLAALAAVGAKALAAAGRPVPPDDLDRLRQVREHIDEAIEAARGAS